MKGINSQSFHELISKLCFGVDTLNLNLETFDLSVKLMVEIPMSCLVRGVNFGIRVNFKQASFSSKTVDCGMT